MTKLPNILFQSAKEDSPYLPYLKPFFQNKAKVFLCNIEPTAHVEIIMRAREKGCTQICFTSEKLLNLLLDSPKKLAKIDAYAGSIIEKTIRIGAEEPVTYEFLALDPISLLPQVPYMRFLYERFTSKFTDPSRWMPIPKFNWSLFEPKDAEALFTLFGRAAFLTADIETGPEDERIITCISFTAVHLLDSPKSYTTTTIVIPFTDEYNVAFTRKLLALPNLKVFQNGKYDNAYLLRYNTITRNYGFDTINAFHSWYSELPKDLGFITSFLIRSWKYWKDEGKTTDLMQYYEYNAKDSFTTAIDTMALMLEMPDWAWENFYKEFPLVFPCMIAENRGILCDQVQMARNDNQLEASINSTLASLQKMVANPFFNPNSPLQTQKLFEILGSGDIKSTGVAYRDKVAARHPLNAILMSKIKDIRGDRKLRSNYTNKETLWNGRIFYKEDPHATVTSRLASSESQFWCGQNIQNYPRDKKDIQIRSQCIADPGFLWGSGDYKQNETWWTAGYSGDTNLWTAVSGDRDFHGVNASMFFAVPYSEIIGPNGEKLNKELRDDIGKRINHGANYNMQGQVMLDTMGIKNVIKAKKVLKLPDSWALVRVCDYLLSLFDKAYPTVRDKDAGWYKKIINDVNTTGFLVGATGWHRRCFSDPTKSKRAMNMYAAHPPQSGAAQALNAAYLRVFYEVQLKHPDDFKLMMQVHDSIEFQYREGRIDLLWKARECMIQTIPITDIYGKVRQMCVPVDMKGESKSWSGCKDLKWQEAA